MRSRFLGRHRSEDLSATPPRVMAGLGPGMTAERVMLEGASIRRPYRQQRRV